MLPHKKLNNKLGKMTLKCESCTKFSWWWIGWKVVNETHRQPEIEEGGLMHTQREPTEIVWRTYTQTLCSHRYTHSHRYFPEKGGKADWTLKDCARALFAFFFFAVVFSLSLSLLLFFFDFHPEDFRLFQTTTARWPALIFFLFMKYVYV